MIIVFVVLFILLLSCVLMYFLLVKSYNKFFNHHFNTFSTMYYNYLDFGLDRQTLSYNTNDKKIKAFIYSDKLKKDNYKGLVVVVHSYSRGGHNFYLDAISYFCKHDYLVFTYDASGCDETSGVISGLPQGVIDLDYALNYIKNSELNKYDLFLFGHSWGAYCSLNVLKFYHNIKAVASLAGFNKSTDSLLNPLIRKAGNIANIAYPFITLIERIRFGKYGKLSFTSIMDNTNTKVVFVHDPVDKIVPYESITKLIKDKYANNDKYKVIIVEGAAHPFLCQDIKSRDYFNEFDEGFFKLSKEDKLKYPTKKDYYEALLPNNVKKDVNIELFDEILSFFES